jgi:hypothetical protein
MKTLNQYLNWLTVTASGLCATLLLVTGAQAADSITTTSRSATATFAQSSPNQLIALRKKNASRKKPNRKQKQLLLLHPLPPRPQILLKQLHRQSLRLR